MLVCRRRMRQSFSRGLLGRTVAPVLVRRCAGRVDAKVPATLLKETVDVQRLGVGLDGDVVRTVSVLLDVSEELVENVCCL